MTIHKVDISCITPENIDFKNLTVTAGNDTEFNFRGKPVEVKTLITNTGTDTVARKIYLLENTITVDSTITQNLIPGQIDTVIFSWIPSILGNQVFVKTVIEDDPQATNDDNSQETSVSVFKSGALIESFESDKMPLGWVSKLNTSVIVDNS